MRKLPIGISTFSKIIDGDFVYVDKTHHLHTLASHVGYYFLSRPRRFGKSVLVDTLKDLFEGNKKLFKGLYIEDKWDWETHYSTITLTFTKGTVRDTTHLGEHISQLLQENQERLDIRCDRGTDNADFFYNLIKETKRKFKQDVVVLIDEYDKPLLDNLSDTSKATAIRDELRSFYSVIKAQDANIRFALLTGVSKFSKVSVFSGLNNLNDITLSQKYSDICGYTQQELETSFAEHLQNVDLEKVREWYNGYNWTGKKVYNPFDILLFLDRDKQFHPYWFETGTPSFLLKQLEQKNYYLPSFENLEAASHVLTNFEISNLQLETLLFQSGYLTITNVNTNFDEPIYTLGFPNREVRNSFNSVVLQTYLQKNTPDRLPVLRALQQADLLAIESHIAALFEAIPNDNYRKSPIAAYEGFYASVVYAFFASLGINLIAEDTTNRGRIDLTIQLRDTDNRKVIYVIEFKVISGSASGSALQQIKDRGYAKKYLADNADVYLVGVEFDTTSRSLAAFDAEQA